LMIVVRSMARTLQPARQPVEPAAGAPRAVAPPAVVDRTLSGASGLRLLVLESGGSDLAAGQEIVAPDGATFGRADRASIVVADPAVSAEHARLTRLDGVWRVVDLGSTNGTLVNQAHVQGEATLHPGDVLGLGNVRLKVIGR
jgi:pSer/pThr/pTyr-binding forkhead associated (FHA) protein